MPGSIRQHMSGNMVLELPATCLHHLEHPLEAATWLERRRPIVLDPGEAGVSAAMGLGLGHNIDLG